MDELRAAVLIAATMTTGIAAGVYQLYSFVIMPGLGKTDDRTLVAAYQQIDRVVVGPYLLVFFIGPLALTTVALGLNLGEGQRDLLPWIAAALALEVPIVLATVIINVPLNNDIKAAGDPDAIDVTATRTRFNEARWLRSNLFRVVASTTAFGFLAWTLVLHGGL